MEEGKVNWANILDVVWKVDTLGTCEGRMAILAMSMSPEERSAGCRVQGAGCRVQDAGCRVQGTCEGRVVRMAILATSMSPEERSAASSLPIAAVTVMKIS